MNFGAILGGICAIILAPTSFFGIPGWSFSFLVLGSASVAVGRSCRVVTKFWKDCFGSDELAALLLLGLPAGPSSSSSWYAYALVLFVMGFCISWNSPATNNPIFAEIVPERSRTSVYALDRCFESILSPFAPPFVGLLAQHVYGYKPVAKGSSASEEIATDRGNAGSLAIALYTAIGVPMSRCCLIYSFLYSTYPRDRESARMEALIESEMTTLDSREEPQTVIELDHEAQDCLDSDEDNEKTL